TTIGADASSRMAIWAGDGTEGSGDYFPSDPDVIDVGEGDAFAPKEIAPNDTTETDVTDDGSSESDASAGFAKIAAPIFIMPVKDVSLGDEVFGDDSGETNPDVVDDGSSEIDYATIVAEEKDASLGIDEIVSDTAPESDPALV
ncbi:MAG TPA: hypothetical protein PLV92_24855, partial [Pirellulaceae bacterium]|nr:hypothetical protein [Pirellulaceae bacterium]